MTSHPSLPQAVDLLSRLVATPSLSREEDHTATLLYQWLREHGVNNVQRIYNNVWAMARPYNPALPTLMLNSHHDTVKPSPSYTRDPFTPAVENGCLYGLGSNDAGGSAVALALSFLELREEDLPFNLMLALTAAEEVMDLKGMRSFLPHISGQGIKIDMAIVGEPTGLQPAVAERGLVVLDGVTRGVTGHAARNEGVNALYLAIDDINRLRYFKFDKESETLGPVKISVTMINSGRQHNVVPEQCDYVVDVRTTDAYTNAETVGILQKAVANSTLTPRSTRISASVIAPAHPLVASAVALGKTPFVSPTTSDMALMPGIDSLKIGPGQSSRSHSADEYIRLDELDEALRFYPALIRNISTRL